ncbi:MAG: RsiV family protein [Bacteroidota bacterium]
MNYIFRLLIFASLFSSCTDEPSLTFSSEEFTESQLEICKNEPCSQVTILYPKALGHPEVSAKVNSVIEQEIIQALFLGDDASPSAKSIPDAATDFIMAYRDHQPDIPSDIDIGGYIAEIVLQNTFENSTMVSVESIKYLHTGGAHGYDTHSFLNFDLQTGELLSIQDLFQDLDQFKKVAEMAFKKEMEIPTKGNINETGYWFENGRFNLPETIGFVDDKILLHYNSYEILAHRSKTIEIEIPIAELTSALDNQYQ